MGVLTKSVQKNSFCPNLGRGMGVSTNLHDVFKSSVFSELTP